MAKPVRARAAEAVVHDLVPSVPSHAEPEALGPPVELAVTDGYSLDWAVENSPVAGLLPLRYSRGPAAHLRCALQPALVDAELGGLPPLDVAVIQAGPGQPLAVHGLPGGELGEALLAQLRSMLQLDEDLSLFYMLADRDPGLAWAGANDAGRLLRSPSCFEDLMKCLLLGRAARGRAERIVTLLCSELGTPTRRGIPSFPTAAALASAPSALFEREPFHPQLGRAVRRMSELCAGGSFYAETLRRPEITAWPSDVADLQSAIEQQVEWHARVEGLLWALPGVSDRASLLLMPLLGCYDGVTIDAPSIAACRGSAPPAPRSKPATPEAAHAERRAEVQTVLRRLHRYSIYRGLAQRLLVAAMTRRPAFLEAPQARH